MCYSAQIEKSWRKYLRVFGSDSISLDDFIKKFWWRQQEFQLMKIPKVVESWFAEPTDDEEREIAEAIRLSKADRKAKFEKTVFEQRKRVADAERVLAKKVTKKAQEDVRIGSAKVEDNLGWIADIKRSEFKPRDARIFPGWYAPVIISENGKPAIRLMRYQCRPAGRPKFFDAKYPGTYNARRDSLGGYWKDLFGYKHGIMLATTFFENVSRHKVEQRELAEGEKEENVILEFKPRGLDTMYVACLWSNWKDGDEELDSFAAITDEPPPEVAAAGHDRCIIPIKEENIEAWLNPDASSVNAMLAVLDDRARAYYENRLAA